MKYVLFIVAIIAVTSLQGCGGQQNMEAAKIQDCPEMMIDNRMPRIIDENSKSPALPSKYYIYKGERREIAEFDTAWVNKNCDVEVQVVY